MYHKHSPHFTVETNDAQQLVAAAAGNIEKLLAKRSQALKVSASRRRAGKNPLFFCQSLIFRWRSAAGGGAELAWGRWLMGSEPTSSGQPT